MDVDLWGLLAVAAKMLAYGGSLVAAGSALFLLALAPAGVVAATAGRAGLVALCIAAMATVAFVLVQAGYLVDEGLSGMLDPFILGLVTDGPLGLAAATRLAGLALLALALTIVPLRLPAGLAGAVLVAASFALSGHATGEPRLVLSAIIVTHLLGVSFWIGALWPLYRAVEHVPLDEAAALAHRFGNQAIIIVPALLVAGALFTILRVDPVSALSTSSYGWTLAAKLLVVIGLLALAHTNRLYIVPDMQAGEVEAGARLRRSIALEAGAFGLIFLATAVLTTLTPIPGS